MAVVPSVQTLVQLNLFKSSLFNWENMVQHKIVLLGRIHKLPCKKFLLMASTSTKHTLATICACLSTL